MDDVHDKRQKPAIVTTGAGTEDRRNNGTRNGDMNVTLPGNIGKTSHFQAFMHRHFPEARAHDRWALVFTAIIAMSTALYTLFAGWTLYEIRSGSSDTHTLAEAAKKQAEKTTTIADSAEKIRQSAENIVAEAKRNADNSQRAIEASGRQNKAALDASIGVSRDDQRAWVAEVGLGIDAPEVGKTVRGYATWNNSGKTFARKVHPLVHFAFVPQVVATEEVLVGMVGNVKAENGSIGVLAPGGQYKSLIETKQETTETDKARINGEWYTYLWGELTYEDLFRRQHNTLFCSWRKGPSGEFIQCPFHNDAD